MSVKGSCLCGGIAYEVKGPLGRVVNCHCSICRKATGAAFRTRAKVATASFHWLRGEALLSEYKSSPGETRTFCRICGATLPTFFRDLPDEIGLPLGTLDDDPGVRPSAHVWVGSKAPWWEITDTLPQYSEGIPSKTSRGVPGLRRVMVDESQALTPGGIGTRRRLCPIAGPSGLEVIVDFEPPWRMVYWASDESLRGLFTRHRAELRCEPSAGGTRLRWIVRGVPSRAWWKRIIARAVFRHTQRVGLENLRRRFRRAVDLSSI